MEVINAETAFVDDNPVCENAKLIHNTKWTDEMIRKLIKLWGERPALYDTKHEYYFSKYKRREAMNEICDVMDLSFQEVQLKMVSLRTYYGSQQRKKIAWDNDPSKTTPFSSRWQFWTTLQFLQDHMTQKQSEKTTFPFEDDCCSPELIDDSERVAREARQTPLDGTPRPLNIYALKEPPRHFKEKVALQELQFNDNTDVKRIKLLNDTRLQVSRTQIAKRKSGKFTRESEASSASPDQTEDYSIEKRPKISNKEHFADRSDDELFTELLLKSLSKIKEGEAKEALKLEIQNLVFRTRFGSTKPVFASSQVQTPGHFNCQYSYDNSVLSGIHSNNASDEEPTLTMRRKSLKPKRSVATERNKSRENCEIVTVAQEYSGQTTGQL